MNSKTSITKDNPLNNAFGNGYNGFAVYAIPLNNGGNLYTKVVYYSEFKFLNRVSKVDSQITKERMKTVP
jgi:hypothetical protein